MNAAAYVGFFQLASGFGCAPHPLTASRRVGPVIVNAIVKRISVFRRVSLRHRASRRVFAEFTASHNINLVPFGVAVLSQRCLAPPVIWRVFSASR